MLITVYGNKQTGRQVSAHVVFLMLLTEVAAWDGVHSRQCGLSLGYQLVRSHSVQHGSLAGRRFCNDACWTLYRACELNSITVAKNIGLFIGIYHLFKCQIFFHEIIFCHEE